MKIKKYIKKFILSRIWKKNNKHNFTYIINYFDISKVSVGKMTYGGLNVKTFGNAEEKLSIGNYCSIGSDVKFILGGNHEYNHFSTYPFKVKLKKIAQEATTKGPIVINDDVWIGESSIILSGVNIGQGAIIGAGSIVSKDIPPYAIYCGNKIIKYRFDKEIIDELIKINYSKLSNNIVHNNMDLFYSKMDLNLAIRVKELINGEK